VRPDQTDPETNTMTPRPVRADTAEDPAAMRRRERAGSPSPEELEGTSSWQDIKSRFVDDPKGAIAAAEELVRRALDQRVRALKDEAEALCAQARDDESSSTEGMRTRLIRYQEYCSRKTGA
jgi:hypothetical protein